MKAELCPDAENTRRTIDFWQPRSGQPLSHENARQIVQNVAGFFRVLNEWAVAEARVCAVNADQGRAGPSLALGLHTGALVLPGNRQRCQHGSFEDGGRP